MANGKMARFLQHTTSFLWKTTVLIAVLPLLAGCIREEDTVNSPQGNFEALWRIIDEQYCFLEYKQTGMPSAPSTAS
jgi:CDP-diacylglycerol pyrophosphatase